MNKSNRQISNKNKKKNVNPPNKYNGSEWASIEVCDRVTRSEMDKTNIVSAHIERQYTKKATITYSEQKVLRVKKKGLNDHDGERERIEKENRVVNYNILYVYLKRVNASIRWIVFTLDSRLNVPLLLWLLLVQIDILISVWK